MPTSHRKYQDDVANREGESPSSPQPVSISIALGVRDDPPSRPHQSASTGTPTSSHEILKTTQSQGEKSPRKPAAAGVSGREGYPQSNSFHRTNTRSPTRRTKKIAKPRTKAKTGPPAREPPAKENSGATKLDTDPAERETIPPPKQKSVGKTKRGESTTAAISPKEDIGLNKNAKNKSKRSRASSPNVEPAKKRAKKQTVSSTKSKEADDAKQGGGASPKRSPTVKKKSKVADNAQGSQRISQVVGAVVDKVADEIHYCASMFGFERVISHGGDVSSCKKHIARSEASSGPESNSARTVVMAVRRFALEVYCPFLTSAMKASGNLFPTADRVSISTLLAIREMLIMNASKLFSFSSMKRQLTNGAMEDETSLARVLANAIVRNTAKRLNSYKREGRVFADFVEATRSYDAMGDDFQFSLTHADVQSIYVHPDGEKVGQQQSILAKVSFNFARARHPLLCGRRSRLIVDDERVRIGETERSLTPPMPTACAAFHIEAASASASDEKEDASASDGEDDTAEILESLKQALRSDQA